MILRTSFERPFLSFAFSQHVFEEIGKLENYNETVKGGGGGERSIMKEAADVLAGCVCGFTTRMFVAPLGTC